MKKWIIMLPLILASCTSVTVLKPGYPSKSPEEVTVILDTVKEYNISCKNYEHIGLIVTAWKWNGEMAIEEVKEKTAEIGGNYFIGNFYVNNFNDTQISGNAYICEK